MYIYIIIFSISLFFAYLAEINKNKENNRQKTVYYTSVTFSFMTLFLFLGLRYDVGFDYLYTYVPEYNKIKLGYSTHFEPLFILLNKFVYYIFNNVYWVFIISAFLTVYLVYSVICKRGKNIFFGVFLFIGTRMYLYSFTQVRQYIAIAIFLYATKYITERKKFKYFFSICIAALFHKIALIYLPIYFIGNIKLTKQKYSLIALLGFALIPIVTSLYNYIGRYLYGWYINNKFGIGNYSSVMLIMNLFTIIISILYYNNLSNNKNSTMLLNLQLVAWILCITTIQLNESYRIVALFSYTSILLLQEIYYSLKIKSNRKILFLLIFVLYTACLYAYLKNDPYMLPYKTIFNK